MLGIALPIALAVWGFGLCSCLDIEPSISDYYSLRTRDVFVGILFAIATFFAAYKGYDHSDRVAGVAASVTALGVALFPNTGEPWERIVHFTSATALFSVLAYFCIFLFTKTSGLKTPQKERRNRIYVACGAVMVACILSIGGYYWVLGKSVETSAPVVFWLESFALWAFGISWLVKGEALMKDKR